jgi:hypothetical protein
MTWSEFLAFFQIFDGVPKKKKKRKKKKGRKKIVDMHGTD